MVGRQIPAASNAGNKVFEDLAALCASLPDDQVCESPSESATTVRASVAATTEASPEGGLTKMQDKVVKFALRNTVKSKKKGKYLRKNAKRG